MEPHQSVVNSLFIFIDFFIRNLFLLIFDPTKIHLASFYFFSKRVLEITFFLLLCIEGRFWFFEKNLRWLWCGGFWSLFFFLIVNIIFGDVGWINSEKIILIVEELWFSFSFCV